MPPIGHWKKSKLLEAATDGRLQLTETVLATAGQQPDFEGPQVELLRFPEDCPGLTSTSFESLCGLYSVPRCLSLRYDQ